LIHKNILKKGQNLYKFLER